MKLVKEHINEVVGIMPIKYIPPFDGDINLSGKNLTELPKDLPKKITGSFYCSNNKLTSLKGSPTSVGEDFYCHKNERQLTNQKLYFHRFKDPVKDPEKYERLKQKGMDITVGNGESIFGGILIRTIENEKISSRT